MDLKLAVTADFASTTAEGKLNILGIFDQMSPPSLPFALPLFYIVVTYEAGPAEVGTSKTTEIVLQDSDGGARARLRQEIVVPPARRPGSRSVINQINALVGLQFEQAGDYQFVILVNGEEKGSLRLHVSEPMKQP